MGKNGCGKTTLMKIIDGRIEPDSGSVNIGQTIKIGYYTQELENNKEAGIAYMNPDDRVIAVSYTHLDVYKRQGLY